MLWESKTGGFSSTKQSHHVSFCFSVFFFPDNLVYLCVLIFLPLASPHLSFFTFIYSVAHFANIYSQSPCFSLCFPYYQSEYDQTLIWVLFFYYGNAEWKEDRRSRPLEKNYKCFSNFPFFLSFAVMRIFYPIPKRRMRRRCMKMGS